MKSTKQLLEQRAKLATLIGEMRDISNDPDQAWDTLQQEKYDQINTDYDACNDQLKRSQRADEVEAEQRSSANNFQSQPGRQDFNGGDQNGGGVVRATPEDHSNALQAWCRNASGKALTAQHMEAVSRTGINLNSKEFEIALPKDVRGLRSKMMNKRGDLRPIEQRADMDTTSGTGGETIPQGFVNAWEFSMLAFGGVRQVADVFRTETGNALPWPTTNDTGNVGELLAENASSAEAGVTTSSITFNSYKYGSKAVPVSNELMEDSAFNLSAEMGRLLGERIGRITNTHYTTGTGSGQPNGIVTAAGAGITAANAGSIVAADLISLEHSLDPAYRVAGMGTGFMFEDATLKAIKLLVDGDSRPLWQSGMATGDADNINGYPFTINQDVASIATTAVSAVFGAFSKYKIRDVGNIRLRVLTELGALEDQTIFVAYMRTDADLLDSGTDPVVKLTHP